MPTTVNVDEAKIHFRQLIERVRNGEEITITDAGNAIARLVPVEQPVVRRIPGSAIGQVVIAPDFDDPLPEDILRMFE